MRDEAASATKNVATSDDHSHSMPRKDQSSSGFTAVNGALSRPETAAQGDHRSPVYTRPPSNGPSAPSFRPQSWGQDRTRSSDVNHHDAQPRESIETLKRKRTDLSDHEGPNGDAQPPSDDEENIILKRRHYPPAPDSAVETGPSDRPSQSRTPYPGERDHPAIGRSSREPSPVPMNRAPPLPSVRPETERDLAASVQREMQNSPTQARAGVESSNIGSPTYGQNGQASYSPEQQGPHSQLDDNKKRKRVFSNRTKTGCHTCRSRKKKCDEGKPTCHNCERGGFICGGYGVKPPNYKASGSGQKQPLHLQSKSHLEHNHPQQQGYQYAPGPPSEGPRYDHWGRVPGPAPSAPPPQEPPRHYQHTETPSSWHRSSHAPAWGPPPPPNSEPSHHYSTQRPLHPPHTAHTTIIPPQPPPHELGPGQHMPPYGPPPPLPPPPPSFDAGWSGSRDGYAPHRRHTGTYSATSSGNSGYGQSHSRSMGNTHAFHERYNMLVGQPFGPYVNNTLLADRQACQAALERYNSAADSRSGISPEERGRFFRAIVEPPQRGDHAKGREPYNGPIGKVGPNVVVESPFHCDYGYNIHLGENIVVMPGCKMEDAGEIRIGDRTVIGPNVKFYCMSAHVDYTKRKGSQGLFVAGAIHIGEDCSIGGDAIILPFRKIGRGSTVGAGSVVTKDVPENTVVAGNPAKVIRTIEPGNCPDHVSHVITQQNERMAREMRESIQRQSEANR